MARGPSVVEWPTVGVTAVIYAAFGALTWFHASLPAWALALGGGYVLAWHGSLQHEVVHGHPTPWRAVNDLLVFPSLWLWLPFGLYRESHLRHHDDASLTDPLADPESYYLARARWARLPGLARALLRAHNTVVGRLLIGPPLCVWRLAVTEIGRLARGDRRNLPRWGVHALGCVPVLAWVVGVCGMSLPAYLLLFVYPGIALTLLRSFAEHQAADSVDERTSVVEAGPLMSLLYLNNNLHVAHHEAPGLPWYALPARWRLERPGFARGHGGHLYAGYSEVLRRYLITPRQPVVHPTA